MVDAIEDAEDDTMELKTASNRSRTDDMASPGSKSTACQEGQTVNVGYPTRPARKAVCADKSNKRGRANDATGKSERP